jgi:hypothetical protein
MPHAQLSEVPLLTAAREQPDPGAAVCYRNEAIARKVAMRPGLWLLVFGLEQPSALVPAETDVDVDADGDDYADPGLQADPRPPATICARLYHAQTPAERVALLARKAAAQLAGEYVVMFEGVHVPELTTVLDGDNPIVMERRSWQPLTPEQQQAALAAAVRLATP